MEPADATPPGLAADRVQFETLISDLSARFVAAMPDRVEPAVEAALEEVRLFFRADRCLLLSVSADQMSVRVAYGAYAAGLPDLPAELILGVLFPWSRAKLLDERVPVIVYRRADLPRDAGVDHANSDQAAPIRSNLAVPLSEGPVTQHIVVHPLAAAGVRVPGIVRVPSARARRDDDQRAQAQAGIRGAPNQ